MYRQSLVTAIACTVFPLSVLAATVRVESTPGHDFTKFKRYSWRTHPVFEKRPELAEQYSVGIQLVKNAANEHLIGRGFQSTQGPSDFYITFFLTGAARQDVDVIYLDNAYGWVAGMAGVPCITHPGRRRSPRTMSREHWCSISLT